MATSVELSIRNPSGLHARPAAVFVRAAAGFHSDIRVANVTTGSASVPAKSIIGVLGLGVERGHTIRLDCEGPDEGAAAEALRSLIESGLEENIDPLPPAGTAGPASAPSPAA
ncbi:MAG TPA: HPr family phosphocarrier protein [Candidatus Binatia bacterium]|nr:HPr family phosphocarrier protein [Candidatus Binatia bacterium]